MTTQNLDGTSKNEFEIGDQPNTFDFIIKKNPAQTQNITLTWPADDGDENQFLKNDGSGNLSWNYTDNLLKVSQSTHGFSVLTPLYYDASANLWKAAQANANATLATHIIVKVIDANTFLCSRSGRYTVTSHGKTVDSVYFVDTASSGTTTTTEPLSGYSNPAFFVVDANTIDVFTFYRPNIIGSGIVSDSEIGAITAFAGDWVPEGFLYCDGSAISRSSYAELFAKIGTLYGSGNGTTTFNLPDFRGMFLRGTGSHGSLTMANGNPFAGASVGSSENDQIQGHKHPVFATTVQLGSGGTSRPVVGSSTSNDDQTSGDPVSDGTNGTPRSGDETRPVNYGVKYCIRYAPKGAISASAASTSFISAATSIPAAGSSIYFCTNAADTADITHTLPTATSAGAGKEFTFIKTDSTTYNIIIDGNGSETINGYSSITLDCQNARIKIVSDGSNWKVLEHYFSDKQYSITVTGSNWTTKVATAIYKRDLASNKSCRLFINGTISPNASSITLTVSGVTFKTGMNQTLATNHNGGTAPLNSQCNAGLSTISFTTTGGIGEIAFDGEVLIDSKPTFVA